MNKSDLPLSKCHSSTPQIEFVGPMILAAIVSNAAGMLTLVIGMSFVLTAHRVRALCDGAVLVAARGSLILAHVLHDLPCCWRFSDTGVRQSTHWNLQISVLTWISECLCETVICELCLFIEEEI